MLELIILDNGPEIAGDDNFRINELIVSIPGALPGLRCEMRSEQVKGETGCKDKPSVTDSARSIRVVVENEVEDCAMDAK